MRFNPAVFGFSLALSFGPVSASSQEAQYGPASIKAETLRIRLFAFAHDSMAGRIPGTRGNLMATDYMAAEFESFGLEPAGEAGTFFQTVPLGRVGPTSRSGFRVGDVELQLGTDFITFGTAVRTVIFERAIYGGRVDRPSEWPSAEATEGRMVVLTVPSGPDGQRTIFRALGAVVRNAKFANARAVAVAELDLMPPGFVIGRTQGQIVVGDPPQARPGPMLMMITPDAASTILGSDPATLSVGSAGRLLRGSVQLLHTPFAFPARNVVAVLRGSDPVLKNEYIALTAHNDHIGVGPRLAEHDSIRAFNRVIRPMGADSPVRQPSDAEWDQINSIIDSLRAIRPARPDSIGNGADDDGTGSVGLLEVARAMAAAPSRPARSILFVSHTAEEMGLLGSRYFTDNPTVSRDAIVAEIDQDMIGRGSVEDLPDAGPAYLEVIGGRRVSVEFGDILDEVNALQPEPFVFNLEYDQPGHPLQYFCRADHYSYARYNIPAVAMSRGEHLDYHQLTDEAQYIDYEALARVSRFVHDVALHIANMDHRPVLNQETRDPNAPCVQ